jgi:hypothetical protein
VSSRSARPSQAISVWVLHLVGDLHGVLGKVVRADQPHVIHVPREILVLERRG